MDINNLCPQCMAELKVRNGYVCPHCGFVFSNAQQVKHQLKPFTVLAGKYLVGNVLGEGGFGITYIGFDLVLEIKVAIKEFYPNGFVSRETSFGNGLTVYAGQGMEMVSRWRDNFLKEARSLAKCANLAGVVGVKDYFLENNTAYIVQEFLEGITLKKYVKSNGGRVSADWLLPAMESVIFALGEVHKQGLIHRDISPDNIIMLRSGQMKILDFGAAREFDAEGKSLSVVLKPGYAPIEQYTSKGKQGPWTDVYALAATIYRCLAGVTPPDSMERVITDELQAPGQRGIRLPLHVEQALIKALAVQAENRYQTIAEFQMALYGKGTGSAAGTGAPFGYQSGNNTGAMTGYQSESNTGAPAGYQTGRNTGAPTGYQNGSNTGVSTGYWAGANPDSQQLSQEKSSSASVAAITGGCIAVVLLIGVIAFFAVKRAVGSGNIAEQTAKTMETETKEEKSSESGEAGSAGGQQSAQDSKDETDTADSVTADVNALETAVFEMNGIVTVQDGKNYLELQDPVSVYAYNPQKEAVYLDKASLFLIQDGGAIGDYSGSGVSISGAVSIGEYGQPILQMNKYTVTSLAEEASSVHSYKIVRKDCTWQEAMEDCRAMGGYLARIDSEEEFAAIVDQIEDNKDYESVHFYLGGRREADEEQYYWVDGNNRQIGTPINDSSYWAAPVWMEGEPSFYDGDIVEIYMNMFYYKEAQAWIFNDVPEDVAKYYPGRTGYICEMEN